MAAPSSKGGAGGTGRRGGGPRALAATLARVAGTALRRRGFAEAGLTTEWASIVGAELAAVCLPRKLSFPSRGRRAEGTLTLRVAMGHATTLQHMEPLVIERINGHFGYRAVARLRLQQGPLPRPTPATRRPPPPPDPAADAELKRRTAGIQNPDLRAALERLGRALRQA